MSDASLLASRGRRVRLVEQLQTSFGGIIAASIGVPLVIDTWAPRWFALAWLAVFVLQSAVFIGLLTWRSSAGVRTAWTVMSAALHAAISISVLIWGRDSDSAHWIAVAVTVAFIAFEVAVLPYSGMTHWYAGSAISGLALVVMAWFTVGPWVTTALAILIASMIAIGGRNIELNRRLRRRLAEAEAMVHSDPLTGVLNRRGLEEALNDLDGQLITLAILDVDRFKLVNDARGYNAGDKALVTIARHFEQRLSPSWTLARYGGDEFVAVRAGEHHIPSSISEPINVSMGFPDGSLVLSVTTGSAFGVCDGSADRLMSEAGHALRYAKRRGERSVESRGELQERFDRAFEITIPPDRNPIVAFAQPIVDANGIIGVELLARWQTDRGELLSPGDFMDTVIEKGLMAQLDLAMLKHAVPLAKRLEETGPRMFVSVNLAASALLHQEFPKRLQALLERHQVRPDSLMIEIIETAAEEVGPGWEQAVAALRDMGVLVAIDDFGAGHSNIERLGRLAISHLKIDRSLVTGSDEMHQILNGVTRFCRSSGIAVIAEGVETAADLAALRNAEVDGFQGYLFGRPGHLDQFDDLTSAALATVAAEFANTKTPVSR